MQNFKNIHRWLVVIYIFIFILVHQLDAGLVGNVLGQIQNDLDYSPAEIRLVIMLGGMVGALSLPVWGYLADRFSRRSLLGLSGLLWGMTSGLMAISPTPATFTMSYAASILDNASYPAISSLLADLFQPHDRGKVIGLVQSARPIAFLYGLIAIDDLVVRGDWRVLLIATGAIGTVLGAMGFLFIRDPKRGQSEPALKSINISGRYVFDADLAKQTLKKTGLILLFGLSFVSAVSWNILTSGMVTYLEVGSALTKMEVAAIMIPALLAMTLGYILGGFIGDLISWKRRNGRILVSVIGIVFALIVFTTALQIAADQRQISVVLFSLAGLFTAMVYPNLVAIAFEITLPEVRSSVVALLIVFQLAGGLVGPLAVQALTGRIGIQTAMSWVTTGSWGLGLVFLTAMLFFIPDEMDHVREHLAFRSKLEARLESQK
ncbi:MFS transporter [bacterium]|nr:MFS transporter [bacterium]